MKILFASIVLLIIAAILSAGMNIPAYAQTVFERTAGSWAKISY